MLQQPTVMPDLQSALKRAARNKVKSELQKGLERLFKRP